MCERKPIVLTLEPLGKSSKKDNYGSLSISLFFSSLSASLALSLSLSSLAFLPFSFSQRCYVVNTISQTSSLRSSYFAWAHAVIS